VKFNKRKMLTTNFNIIWLTAILATQYFPVLVNAQNNDPFVVDWKITGSALPDKTVMVGDVVKFEWNGMHNVAFHPSGTCDITDDTAILGETSPVEYTFTADDVGKKTFACDITGHCPAGQIITFDVKAQDVPMETNTPTVEPTTSPTDLVVEQSKEPTDPVVNPTEPPKEPTDPVVNPTEPPKEPTDPVVDPTEPPVEPAGPTSSAGGLLITSFWMYIMSIFFSSYFC